MIRAIIMGTLHPNEWPLACSGPRDHDTGSLRYRLSLLKEIIVLLVTRSASVFSAWQRTAVARHRDSREDSLVKANLSPFQDVLGSVNSLSDAHFGRKDESVSFFFWLKMGSRPRLSFYSRKGVCMSK